jgi:DNA modification methylase
VARIIKVASNPDDVVLDPFASSGTVLVAAEQLGRQSMAIELSEQTAALARKRLESVTPPLWNGLEEAMAKT